MTVDARAGRAAAGARASQPPAAPDAAFAGALAVDSRPTGAKVFMDGKLVGTTPLALPSVPAGSHAIRLEHDGYRRWSSSVRDRRERAESGDGVAGTIEETAESAETPR